MLPKDATPAQQDSAIQATFQPAQIRYSSRPDTLRLPGQPLGKSVRDVSLPQYYRESFFKTDSLLHPELNGGRMGVAGDPVPYRAYSDDVISLLLLSCFAITMIAVSHSMQSIYEHLKNFFYLPHEGSDEVKDSSSDIRYQLLLCLQTGVLLSLSFFLFSQEQISETYILSSEYTLMLVFFGIFAGYFIVKDIILRWIHWTFFEAPQIHNYNSTRLYLTSFEGIILLPAVLIYTYFAMSPLTLLYYTISVIGIIKLLTFYKLFSIFFRGKERFLQIFLYFCTLEVIPLVILWELLLFAANSLKVTY